MPAVAIPRIEREVIELSMGGFVVVSYTEKRYPPEPPLLRAIKRVWKGVKNTIRKVVRWIR